MKKRNKNEQQKKKKKQEKKTPLANHNCLTKRFIFFIFSCVKKRKKCVCGRR